MRLILCTTGTSIARNCPALKACQARAMPWGAPPEALVREVDAQLAALDLRGEAGRVAASAELHSLHRLQLQPEDHVVLFATDTADGRVCAEAAAKGICSGFDLPEDHVMVRRVEGLQVQDANSLRTRGLPGLVSQILLYAQDPQWRYGAEVVLNPTGGYKGVVPFVAVMGMILRLRTVYIFEFATTLIQLPPLPVAFDLRLYERAADALSRVYDESEIAEHEFYRLVEGFQPDERSLFDGFLEASREGFVTLSPLALAMVETQRQGATRVRLSAASCKALESAGHLQRLALERILLRVGMPLFRSMHRHAVEAGPGFDLEVYKPGNTPERAFYAVAGDAVFVCLLFADHDTYVAALRTCRRCDFDLDKFVEWQPRQAAAVESAYRSALAEEERSAIVNEARREAETLVSDLLQRRNTEIEDLRAHRRVAQERRLELEQENRSLRGNLRAAQAQCKELQQELAALRAPPVRPAESPAEDTPDSPGLV